MSAKIYQYVPTLKNSTVKLIVATSEQQEQVLNPWHADSAGMNGRGSLVLIPGL